MNLVKLHTKIPNYDIKTGREDWPEEWREEFVNLSNLDRIYISEFNEEVLLTTIIMGNATRFFVKEPLGWVINNAMDKTQISAGVIPEYHFPDEYKTA